MSVVELLYPQDAAPYESRLKVKRWLDPVMCIFGLTPPLVLELLSFEFDNIMLFSNLSLGAMVMQLAPK